MKTRRRGPAAVLVLAVVALAALLRPYPQAALAPALGTSPVLTDRHGQVLRVLPSTSPAGGRAVWVSLSQVAPLVLVATLAGEDHRFFDHPGVDVRAVARAVWLLGRHGHVVSGASTLTMQLARTLEPRPRSLRGKLGEMLAAVRIERTLDKPAVLEQYLNRICYGAGAFGIEAAARRFFGRSAAALSDGEATLLAVLPRAPRRYDLRTPAGRDAALVRRAVVLAAMERQGHLSASERQRIQAQPLSFVPAAPSAGSASHFVQWAVPPGARVSGTVQTTLDLALQQRLEQVMRVELGGGSGQAGLVVIEPASGAVRAMVGAAGTDSQLNITTTARHPGSALKPFVYALALERGASPATLAQDNREALPGYRPFGHPREHGQPRFREALGGSFNLAAVDVLDGVGVAPLLERLRGAGIGPLRGSVDDYGLDLALGSARVRLVDLAAAYGAFVNGGRVVRARSRVDQATEEVQLLSPETAWLVMDMLADPGPRRAVFGARLPFDLPFPVAAKTGTSGGYADTLAIAATREAVVAAWSGAFDGSGTGGTLAMWSAAPLVRAALLVLAERAPLTLPPPPASLVTADVCGVTGLLPSADCPHKRERFAAGAPVIRCAGHEPLSESGVRR